MHIEMRSQQIEPRAGHISYGALPYIRAMSSLQQEAKKALS
jgi:hypothetical protein